MIEQRHSVRSHSERREHSRSKVHWVNSTTSALRNLAIIEADQGAGFQRLITTVNIDERIDSATDQNVTHSSDEDIVRSIWNHFILDTEYRRLCIG